MSTTDTTNAYNPAAEFAPGARVEVEQTPSTAVPATVIYAETRQGLGGQYLDKLSGYLIRYDDGCQAWVRDYRVRALPEPAPEPGPYAEVAAELRRIADDLASITGDQPALDARVSLSVPWRHRDTAAEVVDPVAVVLTGEPGKDEKLSSSWYHQARCDRGPVHVWIYSPIDDPTVRDRDAELARLRAENAALNKRLEAATAAAILTPDAVTA